MATDMTGAMVRLPQSERDQYEAWARANGITTWNQMCRTLMAMGMQAVIRQEESRDVRGNVGRRHAA